MHDFERKFWAQQIRMGVSIVVFAIAISLVVTWLTTDYLDAAHRHRSMVVAFLLSGIVASMSMVYAVRQNLTNHRLHLQVQRHANHDDLTGLANRRSFSAQATAHLSAAATPQTLGLILVDIDWFKRVNDTHGHEAGDETLCHIAQTLQHAAPDGALVARLGGEEFTIMCDVDSQQGLSRIAEALRRATEASGFFYNGEKIRITISLGLTLARPGDTLSTLLSRADHALYEAKRHGRNRFELAA